MIYEVTSGFAGFGRFGQARRGATVPREEAAPGVEQPQPQPTGYMEAAQMLASSILAVLRAGYGVTPDQAVRMADRQINPDQRFYDVEFHQAAILLNQSYPAVTTNAWLLHLGNMIGYRRVIIPICRYGEVVDPVTRACVPETVIAPEPEVRIPEVPEREAEVPAERPEERPEEKKPFEVPVWAWGVGAGLAVLILVFMGGRR